MAEALADSTAKLQLDEETGEMVSKGELKKRMKKREKAVAKATHAAASKAESKPSTQPSKPKDKPEEAAIDPDSMFKTGFLDEVFKIRPMKPVITRFPPEPNGLSTPKHPRSRSVSLSLGGDTC